MLEKQDLILIKDIMQEVTKETVREVVQEVVRETVQEVVQEVVQREIAAAKEELRGEMRDMENRLHEEIVAVREDLQGDMAVVIDEIERTRNILEGKIVKLDNRMAEMESCYRSDRLEHDTMQLQYEDLEKRVGRLERKKWHKREYLRTEI